MRIEIGKYVIESNGRGYECYKPVYPGKKDKKGHEIVYHRKQQFYSDIESLLKSLPERMVMSETDTTTLSGLLDEIKRYNALIEAEMRR
jgi:hypothetical protein